MPAFGREQQKSRSLQEKLLLMASHAEAAVNRAIKALLRRDDELARLAKEQDTDIDRLEVEIDHIAVDLLSAHPTREEVTLIMTATKISHDLERVGDEATTISRRCVQLAKTPPVSEADTIPQMAEIAMRMLRDSVSAFVSRNATQAREVIERDEAVDAMNKSLRTKLAEFMSRQPETVAQCLNLMTIAKSLERIADHASNIAEMVVYLSEGRDIRHSAALERAQSEP